MTMTSLPKLRLNRGRAYITIQLGQVVASKMPCH